MTNMRAVAVVLALTIGGISVLGLAVAYRNGEISFFRTASVENHEFPKKISLPVSSEGVINQLSNAVMTDEKIPENNPTVTLRTSQGDIVLELYRDKMPITAGNFLSLARSGFYHGTKFHRVIDGFMIQGGDPNSKTAAVETYGTGGPGYVIEDEYVTDEKLSNIRGTIAMANSGPRSGGSQFFINVANNTGLDFDKEPLSSKHPVFGRVISGMDIVDAIARTPTGERDVPLEPIVITETTVEER